MTFPNQIDTDQENAAAVVNEELGTLAHQAVYGKRSNAPTTGLQWGYYGGRWGDFAIADGTLTLPASSTCYVVVAIATGVISVSATSTHWDDTDNYRRVYKITTGTSTVSGTPEDHRVASFGVLTGGASSGTAYATSADLAADISDETGSGSLVFANAPTLVNPIVGTQSAGDSSTKAASTAFVAAAVAAGVAGLSWKQAVRVATTAAGTLASSFENGDTVDGVTLATGDRILIKNQSTASENGIYIVAASGAPARASDADSGAELVNASVYVSEGTTNADTQWTCTTNATITVGSTSLAFAQLTSGGSNTFSTISVSGQSDVVADSSSDTLTLVAGTGIAITTNAGTDTVTIAATGGSGGTKTYAVLTPMNSQPPASNYATLDTRNSIAVLDYDDTTEESAFWVSVMPEAASLGSGLKVTIYWMCTTATSGNVRWGVQFERMNTDEDSDSFDTATEGHSATSGTSGIITATTLTCTTIDSIAAQDVYRIRVYRDVSDTSNDTVAGDAELVAVQVWSAA